MLFRFPVLIAELTSVSGPMRTLLSKYLVEAPLAPPLLLGSFVFLSALSLCLRASWCSDPPSTENLCRTYTLLSFVRMSRSAILLHSLRRTAS